METDLFNLSFDNWKLVLFQLIPILINIGIFLYIIAFLPATKTNNNFTFFVLMLGLWQLGEGFTRTSLSPENAIEWYRISGGPSILMLPFGLLFALRFTNYYRKIPNILLWIFIFFPAILFESFVIARLDQYIIIRSDLWNWIIYPKPSVVNIAIYLWMSAIGVTMAVLFWLSFARTKTDKIKRMQFFLLATGFTIPVIGGIIAEVIFPLLIQTNSIPLTATLTTIFSVTSIVAIKRYSLLDYSPRHQWNQILEEMNEGVLIVDNNNRIMYSNKKLCEIIECAPIEIKNKSINELFIEKIEQNKQDEYSNTESKRADRYEALMRTKSGKKIWMHVSELPYLDRHGDAIGTVEIMTDITSLKNTEERLREKIHALNTLLYKVSHDLKSPAISIQGLMNLYKEGAETDVVLLHSFIEKCTYQLLMVVDNIDRIASIMQQNIKIEEIDIEEEVKSIFQRITTGEENIELKTHITLNKGFSTDRTLLNISLRNILDNAIRYRDLKKPACRIEVRCRQRNNNVEIRISDNGQGIPENLHGQVFDLFFKANASAAAGLGLYTVKCATEKLGGTISMKSSPGQGTELSICLPGSN